MWPDDGRMNIVQCSGIKPQESLLRTHYRYQFQEASLGNTPLGGGGMELQNLPLTMMNHNKGFREYHAHDSEYLEQKYSR